jgi:hypothetical protein
MPFTEVPNTPFVPYNDDINGGLVEPTETVEIRPTSRSRRQQLTVRADALESWERPMVSARVVRADTCGQRSLDTGGRSDM